MIKRMSNEEEEREIGSRQQELDAGVYTPYISFAAALTYVHDYSSIGLQIDRELEERGFDGKDFVEKFNHLLRAMDALGMFAKKGE